MGKTKELTIEQEIRVIKQVLVFMSNIIGGMSSAPVGATEYIKRELEKVSTFQYKLEEPKKEEGSWKK